MTATVVNLSLAVLCAIGAFRIFRAWRSEDEDVVGKHDPEAKYVLSLVECARCPATAESVFRDVGGRFVPTRLAPDWGTLLNEQENPDDGLVSRPLCPKCCARAMRPRGRRSA